MVRIRNMTETPPTLPKTVAAIQRIVTRLDERKLEALDRELAKAAVRIGASLYKPSGL